MGEGGGGSSSSSSNNNSTTIPMTTTANLAVMYEPLGPLMGLLENFFMYSWGQRECMDACMGEGVDA